MLVEAGRRQLTALDHRRTTGCRGWCRAAADVAVAVNDRAGAAGLRTRRAIEAGATRPHRHLRCSARRGGLDGSGATADIAVAVNNCARTAGLGASRHVSSADVAGCASCGAGVVCR